MKRKNNPFFPNQVVGQYNYYLRGDLELNEFS
jgi:hypothetical protein